METSGKLREFTIGCARLRPHQPHARCASTTDVCERQASFRKKRSRRSSVTNDAADAIIAYATQNPHASTRGIARESGVSKSSVWRVLHGNMFHPFHVSLHQDLQPGDMEKRVEFSNWLLNMTDEDGGFPLKIMFSDEANFARDAQVNLHNAHYWAVENPRWLRKCRFQKKWSFNVWAGIFNGTVVGPYFFDGTLTGNRYKTEILQGVVDQFICDIPLSEYKEMYFQHDGAPPHAAVTAREWLDAVFPEKWIGRGSNVSWPPRSPDLNPLDFFWGYLKDVVYDTDPTSPDTLQGKIRAACDSLTPRQLQDAAKSLVMRCQLCIAEEGGHFEHLL